MKKMILSILLLVSASFNADAQGINADVVKVTVTNSGGHYGFHVTLSSDETGCGQYADWWEVLDDKGTLLYRRILFHSHPGDQPFTRSGGSILLEPEQKVFIRGHMNKLGYTGDVFVGSISSGFKKAEELPSFPETLEKQAPLPNGCAF